MAKKDWQVFYTSGYAVGTNAYGMCWVTRSKIGISGESSSHPVADGGGDRALVLDSRMSGQDSIGWLYKGPSAALFPLRDGSVGVAVRTIDDVPTSRGVFGAIARAQTLLGPGLVSLSGISAYFIGIYQDNTTSATANIRAYRVINGAYTLLSLGTVGCFDYAGQGYCQFEIRLINNGGHVEFWLRYNNGTELSLPGSTGWTSWALVYTDTTPGVLVNAGYWGFGGYQYTSGGSGGTSDFKDPMIDHVTIDTDIGD